MGHFFQILKKYIFEINLDVLYNLHLKLSVKYVENLT